MAPVNSFPSPADHGAGATLQKLYLSNAPFNTPVINAFCDCVSNGGLPSLEILALTKKMIEGEDAGLKALTAAFGKRVSVDAPELVVG